MELNPLPRPSRASRACSAIAAYVLLGHSMLMRTLLWLRLFVIASAVLGTPTRPSSSVTRSLGPSGSLPRRVNIASFLITHWRSLRARFTDVEAHFHRAPSSGPRRVTRARLTIGAAGLLEQGACLAVQGRAGRASELHAPRGKAEVRVGACASRPARGISVGEMNGG